MLRACGADRSLLRIPNFGEAPLWKMASGVCFGTGCSFSLGLLTGFVEASFQNQRMGLAAHLEGVMNGTFVIALGATWSEVKLQTRQKAVAYRTVLYGYWAFTTLAAIFGTATLSPITAAGHSGRPWQEALVMLGFISVGLTIVLASVMVLWGLRRSVVSEAGLVDSRRRLSPVLAPNPTNSDTCLRGA